MLGRKITINSIDVYKKLLDFAGDCGESTPPVLFIESKNLRQKLREHLPQAAAQNVAA